MTKLPSRRSNVYHIATLINDREKMTFDAGFAMHGILGESRSKTRRLYDDAVDSQFFTEYNGVYALTARMKNYVDGCQKEDAPKLELTPPRIICRFTPEMKTVPCHPRIRQDFSPITFSGRPE